MQPSRIALLTFLETSDPLTAREVAEGLRWDPHRAGMALLRAHRTGLVRRGHGLYALSHRGAQRLAWIRDVTDETT
jgi:hypothetical protein